MLLARRGYLVTAIDSSPSIIELAHENMTGKPDLSGRIEFRTDDILDLSFPDGEFDMVWCWGVLTHIQAAESAIAQLARVAKPGGYVVVEDINPQAPEVVAKRAWRSFKDKKVKITKVPAGVEHERPFCGDTLFWRHTNPHWLVVQFERHSCKLVARRSGQATELYGAVPGLTLKSLVHAWNTFWLRYINLPMLAFHNVLIFQKN
jgi:SAM-dependent methyltransferase